MINNMKIGSKLKATKNMFYVTRDNIYEDFYTQEEIMKCVSKMITVGDVYEFDGEDWKCIEGSMVGELSDGYFEMRSMIEKGVFVEVDV
jgi:hypothetical protein